MNGKTARLLKAFTDKNGRNYEMTKAFWNKLPSTKKEGFRIAIEAFLADENPPKVDGEGNKIVLE